MAADLESETCCRSKEGVCGSQWPSAPISVQISFLLSQDRSKHAGIYFFSFLDLVLWRQSGELYGTVSSIKIALTMTMSGAG